MGCGRHDEAVFERQSKCHRYSAERMLGIRLDPSGLPNCWSTAYEPLSPSMRTNRARRQSRCFMTFLQLKDGDTGTVTASDRTCQQAAAPNPLPESDMACRVAESAICRGSAFGRTTESLRSVRAAAVR